MSPSGETVAARPSPGSSAWEGALEAETRRIGRELLARAETAGAVWTSRESWEDRVLNRFLADPRLRTSLLRFVDTYPALRDPSDVTRHFLEYLAAAANRAPLPVRLGRAAMRAGPLGRAPATAAVALAVRAMAGRFICGETSAQAVAAIRRLARRGLLFTIDLLGEEVVSEREADEQTGRYLRLLDELSEAFQADPPLPRPPHGVESLPPAGPLINVSVKISSLTSQFDPIAPDAVAARVLPRLSRIAARARERGAFINLDAEQFERRDLTLDLFSRLAESPAFRDWPHLGIVLQAYLRDTDQAADRVIALARRRGTPVTVRLVKGAYWDYEVIHARQQNWPVPVWTRKRDSDAAFERLARRLLEAVPDIRLAAASHNVRSLAHALALRDLLGVAPDQFECQTLYGMAEGIKAALVSLGVPVRVYTPYGPLVPGMGYLVRRLLENTANESFLRTHLVAGANEEMLLADPKEREGGRTG